MAIVMGIFLPVAETVRRIHQIFDMKEFFSWFDDYIFGMILLYAAFRTLTQKFNAISYLIAAWGIGTGGIFLSLLGQLKYLQSNTADPGIFSSTLVFLVKTVILIYMLIGLRLSIKSNEINAH